MPRGSGCCTAQPAHQLATGSHPRLEDAATQRLPGLAKRKQEDLYGPVPIIIRCVVNRTRGSRTAQAFTLVAWRISLLDRPLSLAALLQARG